MANQNMGFPIRLLVLFACSCLFTPLLAQGVRRPLELPPPSRGDTTLVLSSGVYTVSASLSIPREVNLQVSEGATIAIPAGATLTIQGSVSAGSYHIFSGLGLVSFSGNRSLSTVDAKWWGASGDGTTNDTALLQSALIASTTGAHRFAFYLPASTYRVCDLFLGNRNGPGCPTKAECPAPARVYGSGGIVSSTPGSKQQRPVAPIRRTSSCWRTA
ncbi:MAG: hypothetical protein JWP08_426 [Bryobacterales bacterium]|nr:hypothetical protein [Bryobacterales bacterium]